MSLSVKTRKVTPGTNLGEMGTSLAKRLAQAGAISFDNPDDLEKYVIDDSYFGAGDSMLTAKVPKSREGGGLVGKSRGMFVAGTVYGPKGSVLHRYTADDLPEDIRQDYTCYETRGNDLVEVKAPVRAPLSRKQEPASTRDQQTQQTSRMYTAPEPAPALRAQAEIPGVGSIGIEYEAILEADGQPLVPEADASYIMVCLSEKSNTFMPKDGLNFTLKTDSEELELIGTGLAFRDPESNRKYIVLIQRPEKKEEYEQTVEETEDGAEGPALDTFEDVRDAALYEAPVFQDPREDPEEDDDPEGDEAESILFALEGSESKQEPDQEELDLIRELEDIYKSE